MSVVGVAAGTQPNKLRSSDAVGGRLVYTEDSDEKEQEITMGGVCL
jgi:hypothetical protein